MKVHYSVFGFLDLVAVLVSGASLNISGEAVTTRFWDCCKPSCGWKAKAPFSRPVLSCGIDDKPIDIDAGTGCNGGSAYQCSNQQPWKVNDTFSYGFAGVFIKPELTAGKIEDAWCCACYQLDFTSDPLKGKTMIVQASNTAYDVTSNNRFSLAIPGGNTTSHDACAKQYGVDQKVFGQENSGIRSENDCDNLPDNLKEACKWRFEWYKDQQYPSVNFKRVPCPTELTSKTQCTRNDEAELKGLVPSQAPVVSPSILLATLGVTMTCLFLV
ncbi:glycoside hydrolase family 45 protein [Periconia macrospinosa]|uniref:cellulase n=1 Tax=Periconia macrospinosa TaxID=97972 RepID=A0A2V1D6I3_9PLEO|nr:glycoside hydrolase family 45 protein [Periconia macrospinosa]